MPGLVIVPWLGFVVSFLMTPVMRRLSGRFAMIDHLNERSLHQRPTPRGGGVAIVVALLVGAAVGGVFADFRAAAVLGASLLIALLGVVDDARSLRPWPKLLIQVGAAAVGVFAAGQWFVALDCPPVGSLPLPLAVGSLLTVVWVVGATNEFNFMDGIHGIVSVESMLAAAVFCALFLRQTDPVGAALSLAILGAVAGFLPWNFPSGSIFMGDGGSTTLGFLFALLAVRLAAAGASTVAVLLPLFPFLFDASLTILIRMTRGEKFFTTPHRSHLYQRLVRMGWSHTAVTSLWGLLAAVSCAVAVRYDGLRSTWQGGALGGVVGVHIALACSVLWAHSRRPPRHASEDRE